jgi:dihydropteroate synthase
MKTKSSEIKSIDYSCNSKSLTFNKPLLMAIVNITPDSFYDGGKYSNVNDVLRDIEEKINQGADIIDIGAASSRPEAKVISETEEWNRLNEYLP